MAVLSSDARGAESSGDSRENADPAAQAERTAAQSPWWSDALADPWRDPDSSAMITAPAPPPVPPPPAPEPPRPVRFSPRAVVALSIAAGLLAGLLGGGLGYLASASRRQTVVLGAGASAAPAANLPGSLSDEVTRVLPSVVTVTASSGRAQSIGSGFVIGKDGYILTNAHVVYGTDENGVTVTLADNSTVSATVVGRDEESDIAVLRASRANLSPVFIGDSDMVSAGDGVFAVGTPLALAGTVTSGIVSAVDRTLEADDVGVSRYYAAIQTDAAINRGNSGGPLFDYDGRVVGINAVIKSVVADGGAGAGNIGIAFAIPINQAMRIASDLIATGKAHRTVVGADFDTYDGPGGGLRVTTVDPAGPAAAAGLRPGDVTLRIGSHPVEQPVDMIAMVRRYDPGKTVTITYRRGGATQVANVVLAEDAN